MKKKMDEWEMEFHLLQIEVLEMEMQLRQNQLFELLAPFVNVQPKKKI